ncbi:DUF1707 SHOCT-like domain-containing protein [Streptomyces sp. NPDC012600]|uniref:DUF1707 SHOCT-like domain-containing protein n=1 Tax=Streptomyces sp. NPDC012600 TaxID=3415005 RepID=UPI003C2F49FA
MPSFQGKAGPPLDEKAREYAVQRLQEAYAEQSITHAEMDERLGRVLAATRHGELASALESLPAEQPKEPEKPGTTSTIAAAGGRIRRRGPWRVPRFLTVESALGRVSLDLSRADFEHQAVDIELRLGTGRAQIIVPRDAVVDLEDLRTGWKDLRYRPRRPARPGGPVIRISGAMGYGRLKIRHAWR